MSISICFSHASGTSIIITSGSDLPVSKRSSTTMSMEAESDFPLKITGKISFMSSPNKSESNSSSLEFILLIFPLTVLISPLWHMYLNGCARSQVGKVLVENR